MSRWTRGPRAVNFRRMPPRISRRQIIKSFALGTAFSNIIGRGWAESLLYELKPLSHIQLGVLRIDLGNFPALDQPLGSVRIGTSAQDSSGHRQLGLFPPVIINRSAAGALHVLSAACTHEDCTVRRLDPNSGRMVCPCHGSQFGADGSILEGPAAQPLLTHIFRQSGSVLDIELPDVFFEINAQRVPGRNRVELSFISFKHFTYEVYFRPSITAGAPARVSFATSADGPLSQTEIEVEDDYATVFVERPGKAGLFQIAMKTQVV
jgi:Rieske Fe-S protein